MGDTESSRGFSILNEYLHCLLILWVLETLRRLIVRRKVLSHYGTAFCDFHVDIFSSFYTMPFGLLLLTATFCYPPCMTRVEFVLTVLILMPIYYFGFHKFCLLNFEENSDDEEMNNIGFGLARGFFGTVENALETTMGNGADCIDDYIKTQLSGESQEIQFVTKKPVLIFPELDLLLRLIKRRKGNLDRIPKNADEGVDDSGDKEIGSLFYELVEEDEDFRKHRGERPWLRRCRQMAYEYAMTGYKRNFEFSVLRWEMKSSDGGVIWKYIRVIDDRPLKAIMDWFIGEIGKANPKVTIEDFKKQCFFYKKTLEQLLESKASLKDSYYTLTVKDHLSHELKDFEEKVRKAETNFMKPGDAKIQP